MGEDKERVTSDRVREEEIRRRRGRGKEKPTKVRDLDLGWTEVKVRLNG